MKELSESDRTIVTALKTLRAIAENENNNDLADRCTNVIGSLYSGAV